jgi:23S rRNA (adenine1618-N6)-methyltransferase
MARPEGFPHEYLPFPTQYFIRLPEACELSGIKHTIDSTLSSLDLRWKWVEETSVGVGEATQNVWNRAYRHAQEKRKKLGATEMSIEQELPVAFAFCVQVVEAPAKQIVIDWLRGNDVQLWESFCGMLHRKSRNP